jgi:glycosyltransferase involved in cell wall biosynthesis
MNSSKSELVFLLPTTLAGQQGPVAAWLNTAGWATAAGELGFGSTVVTPLGIIDPIRLRHLASQPATTPGSGKTLAARLPLPVKVAVKDAREWIRARKFAQVVYGADLPKDGTAFVWQRHELFHRAGARLANRLRCPFVLYVPAPKVWEARSWGTRRPGWDALAERFGDVGPMQNADLVACVSDEVAEEVSRLGVDRSRILVTPSTVDTELFKPCFDGSEVRRRYSLVGRFVVGWTGSFRSFHGLDLLLDAVDEARRYVPQLVALFVGDGPERAPLQAEAERRGLESAVRFTGTLPQAELPEVLSAFDVAVVSSGPDETFHYSPLKLWEYLAAARAVVAPSVGSLPRLLENGVNAILVEPGDAHSLARAIVQLANDPSLRIRLGRAGRELAETTSWTHQLKRVIDRLESGGD